MNHIDLAACEERGIKVVNAQGYAKDAVAELTLGLILNVLRNIIPCNTATREGKTRAGLVGSLLKGKTVGIVGTGEIGIRTAELCQAFGAKTVGYSRTERSEAKAIGLSYVSLDELVSTSDIISLHVPLTPQTTNLINDRVIGLMKPSAIVVNVARGGVVDSLALATALNTGGIAGAAIDVFETEPPLDINHPLLKSKNTIVAPHVAFASKESFVFRLDIVLNNIREYVRET